MLESVEGLSENIVEGIGTPEQMALKDLRRFRKRSDVEIDYKAELAKAREEKYANTDWHKWNLTATRNGGWKYSNPDNIDERNDEMAEIGDSYMVFITQTDIFGHGLPIYTINRHFFLALLN